jgi:O-antigen/teichoic acid export membrane protein
MKQLGSTRKIMYKKIAAFSKKEENKELVKHSMLALIIRISGAGVSFLMNVIIARYLGAKEAGYFFLAFTVSVMLATIGRVGADQTVLRFVSIYGKQKEWDKVHGVINTLMKWGLLVTGSMAIIICIFSKPIADHFFHKAAFQQPLIWTAISMPFYACFNLYGMALQGRRKVVLSVSVLRILSPLILVVLALIFTPSQSTLAAILYLSSCIGATCISYYWWHRNTPAAKPNIDKSILWKSCSALWVMAIMQQMVIWGGQFVAGIFNTPQELAHLAVARNTSMLITFMLSAVGYVSAPRFASMFNENRLDELRKYAQNATRLMVVVSLPIIIFIWVFPEFIMSMFGKGFTGGAWYLRVLALGQFINVITGSVSQLLTMSGHEKDMRNITIINGAIAIVLALILNPIFGAMGSAISTAVAVACSNLMAVGLVKKRLGFSTLKLLGL